MIWLVTSLVSNALLIAVSVRLLRRRCSECSERAVCEALLEKQQFVVTGGVRYAEFEKLYQISERGGRTLTCRYSTLEKAVRDNGWMDAETPAAPIDDATKDRFTYAFIAWNRRRALTPWWRRPRVR